MYLGIIKDLFDSMLPEFKKSVTISKFMGDAIFAHAENIAYEGSQFMVDFAKRVYNAFSDKKDIINKGWTHQDVDIFGNDEFAGLIYLTPDIDPDSGTSLWSLSSNVKIQDDPFDDGAEGWYSKDGSFNNGEEYRKLYLEQQKSFVEKLRFQNIFNRLITYDTMEWHGANSYYNGDDKDPRLTLAFFIGGIESESEFPLKRVKNNENEIIKDRIYSNVR